MIKTQGFRKFATLMAIIFGMTMFLAACGTDSSTDEALSQPGDDFVATYQFDVDPVNETMTITPVASAQSTTQVSIKDGFSVTTVKTWNTTTNLIQNPVTRLTYAPTPGIDGFAAGTLTANLLVRNKSAFKLENVSIKIFSTTDPTVTVQANSANIATPGQDNIACNVAGNLGVKIADGTCIASGGPGWTVVGDRGNTTFSPTTVLGSGQWAQPVYECQWNGTACAATSNNRGLRVIGAGGIATFDPDGAGPLLAGPNPTGPSVTTQVALTNSGAQYKFMTHLFAVKRPANLFADPRYDSGNASIILRAYEYQNIQNPNYDPLAPLTAVKQGQWFALVVGADMPGDQSQGQLALCADGNNRDSVGAVAPGNGIPCTLLATATAATRDYDYYFSEDQGNINAFAAAVTNTGFTSLDKVVTKIQWDPAVIATNDNVWATCCNVATMFPPIRQGSAANAFTTAGGTSMTTTQKSITGVSNRMTVTAGAASNGRSTATVTGQFTYTWGALPPLLGDGFDGNDYVGTDIPADIVVGVIALRAIGPAGQGATIGIANTNSTLITIAMGNGSASDILDVNSNLQKGNRPGIGLETWSPFGYNAAGNLEGPNTSMRGLYNDGTTSVVITQ